MAARLISGEAVMGVLPPDVAAKLRASGKDIRCGAVTGFGMLKLLSADPALQNIESLKGHTVYSAGGGSLPEYVIRKILASRGLAQDITLRFSLEPPEITASLAAGRIDTALLPEPFASQARLARPSLRDVCDIQAEWRLATGQNDYPMTLLVFEGGFADAHPEAVRAILEGAKASVAWALAKPAAAGAASEKYRLGMKAAAVEMAAPHCAWGYMSGFDARPTLEALYRALLDFSPASIGGKLPDDDFYMK
jgi:NitT/TauT family transport system substrate-binding protein